MDKYEYKIRTEEIKALIAKGEYADASAIADTIDWHRVKSVMMLCTISDLYKINRRFEDARDMLLLAYDRHPGGRSIVYSLCELSIKMEEFIQAVEYYKEFVQVAPRDSGRYVLLYKLYEAQDVSLEERIAVLEELKSKDYTEKWAYELTYLYHRIGLATKCVEECDELIVWFGEGKYVLKAMELKMLHEPLTPEQQAKYNRMKGYTQPVEEMQEDWEAQPEEMLPSDSPTQEIPTEELDIQVQLMKVGEYDTINMQKELAQNMKELWEGPSVEEIEQALNEPATTKAAQEMADSESDFPQDTDTDILDLPDEENEEKPVEPEEVKVEEVFFGETGEMDITGTLILEEMKKEKLGADTETDTTDGEKQLTATAIGDMKEWHIEDMPTKFDKILGMEYDGQISMIVPESEQIEKQITGQISLSDVLIEWEKMKKDSEQKRMEAVRQRVMEQTGVMFTEFEASARDGLLEQLEKGNGNEKQGDILINGVDLDAPFEDNDLTTLEDYEDLGEAEEIEEISDVDEDSEAAYYDEVLENEYADEYEELDASDTEYYEDTEETEYLAGAEETDDLEDFEEASYTEETAEAGTADFDEIDAVEYAEEYGEYEDTADAEEFTDTEETIEEDFEESGDEEFTEEYAALEDASDVEESKEADQIRDLEDSKETGNGESAKEGETVQKEPEVKNKVRSMSLEERQLFNSYIQSKSTRDQIVFAIDNISMAAYTGNVIITGEEGMDTLSLAKNLVKEIQQTDSNFSGKIAKISSDSLNRKGVAPIFNKLKNGALIIQKAGSLNDTTIEQIRASLEQEHSGLIVIMEDLRTSMNKMLKNHHTLTESFNIRIDVEALDNDTLVAFAKRYAREKECSIDELGVLALHTCIADRQTSDHTVTISEVKEIMDEAIRHACKKTIGHFFDILLAKRYDDEDMIILREKDFIR